MGEGSNDVGEDGNDARDSDGKLERLQRILDQFEISIADANDLVILADYEIVIVADDSGSMSMASQPPHARKLGAPIPSRWDEMKETCTLLVELGCFFDETGLDIYFLNRGQMSEVKNPEDPRFIKAFADRPSGGTPLTETIRRLAQTAGGERPVLLFIMTDGEPNGGAGPFCEEIRRLVKKQSTKNTFKVQIMACTDDEEAVGWMNALDGKFTEVDVTDDYYSERDEVLKAGKMKKFTRGDWLIKALLGPVSHKFDAWDEGGGRGGGGGGETGGSKACAVL